MANPPTLPQVPSRALDLNLVLAIDTCGPRGSVALGRLTGDSVVVLREIELEGRNYSSTLVAAVADLLRHADERLTALRSIVAVNGPGSFTGVRVGLSAVKGLAEAAQLPVVAVSRLEVLAWKAGVPCSALDAHRCEVFLRVAANGRAARELLAGAEELGAIDHQQLTVAFCDDAAEALLHGAWLKANLVRTDPPTAADAMRLCAPRVLEGQFVDLALLDGHYLRRSDAEIFADAARAETA
jgi:tRNA threonylcarbamoyladenosine biosynthesis protein TsaB